MQLLNACDEVVGGVASRLRQQDHFLVVMDVALPAVRRCRLELVDAGGKSRVDELFGDVVGRLWWGRDVDGWHSRGYARAGEKRTVVARLSPSCGLSAVSYRNRRPG